MTLDFQTIAIYVGLAIAGYVARHFQAKKQEGAMPTPTPLPAPTPTPLVPVTPAIDLAAFLRDLRRSILDAVARRDTPQASFEEAIPGNFQEKPRNVVPVHIELTHSLSTKGAE